MCQVLELFQVSLSETEVKERGGSKIVRTFVIKRRQSRFVYT